MRAIMVAGLVAAAIGVTAHSAAQELPHGVTRGVDLLAHCLDPDPNWISFCNGYVQAVYDTAFHSRFKACIPEGTTREDVVNLVVENLFALYRVEGRVSMMMTGSAGAVVQAILHKNFPCDE